MDVFDDSIGAHYNYISSVKNTADEHSHDFYEVFLLSGGRALHYVNGVKQALNEGSLVFIRPDDRHFYEKDYEWDCQLINIAFTSSYCRSLFDYLDDAGILELLVSPKYPAFIELTQPEVLDFVSRFQTLYTLPNANKLLIKLELKSFILELVSCFYSLLRPHPKQELPLWLDALILKMQHKENFAAGLPKMLELAGKTQEHLCRELKRHIRKTPTEFINDLRLNYAKNLLCNTDKSILEICFDSGFENLSHFYHLFGKQFGASPAGFRKKHQKSLI